MANVGDSSALLCSSYPCMSKQANLTHLLDSAFTQQRNGDGHIDNCGSNSSVNASNNSGINSGASSSGFFKSETNSNRGSNVPDVNKNKPNAELVVS